MKDSDSQSSLQAKILDLFQINYDAINNNFDLVLDKLDYIFAQMPIADQAKILERQQIIKRIDCVLNASDIMMGLIDKGKVFFEMDQSPMESRYDKNVGISQQFITIYENLLRQNAILNTDHSPSTVHLNLVLKGFQYNSAHRSFDNTIIM